jgi:hypothetical protein
MPKIYFYKLTVDDDGAPCVTPGLLSLAICKPMIRSTADKEDIIIGFAANSLHADNRLIYVARVTRKLTNGEYFKRPEYAARGDCIYEWRDGRFAVRSGAKHHGSDTDLVHDLGTNPGYQRANILVSQEFCYFGESGSDAYKKAFPTVAKAVANLGRGHRVHHDTKLLDDLERLAKWTCALDGPCIQGKAASQPRCGVSHRGGGCGVAALKAQHHA